MAAHPGEGDDELSRLEEVKNKTYVEWSRLDDEVDELERCLKAEDEKKKELEAAQLKKPIGRRNLAFAKMWRAYYLWQQRVKEKKRAQLVIQSGDTLDEDTEIKELKEKVVEWEEKIKQLLLEVEQDEDLQQNDIEGYTCVGRSVLGCVYMPDTVNVDIQSVSDNTVHPKTSANEVLLTPVVSITSQSQTLAIDKPVVIELMKTTEVDVVGDNKIVAMFSNTDDSIPPNWEDLHEECEVLDDRFRFTTTHFTYFAVIARFSPPTASVTVNPETDFVSELTVPEFPGFSVTIPPKSVPSPIEAKATLYYDESEEWKGNTNERLASACVRLEPEGQKFLEKISVILPIPGHSEIIAINPGAKPQLMYRPNGSSNNWGIHEDMEIVTIDGEFVARFSTDHFSDWRLSWAENVRGVAKAIGTIFKRVTSLSCRCQVFMSRETEVGSVINFSVQGLVYQFQDPPQEIPLNYHYILHDSGTLPIRVPPGELSFTLELKEYLIPDKEDKINVRFEKSRKLSHDCPARPKYDIDLNKNSKTLLKEGAVIAYFSVNNSDGLVYECDLLKLQPSQKEVSDRHQPAPSDVKTVSSKKNKAVKSGQITDSDRLFKNLADFIYNKYPEIGFELGLKGNVLENELETGNFTMQQGNKKAIKMLQLWRESVKEDEFTYSALADALEKNGFLRCADKYCYTSIDKDNADRSQEIIEETEEGDEGNSDNYSDLETSETTCEWEPLINVTDKVNEEPPTIGRRISRWCSCNCFK